MDRDVFDTYQDWVDETCFSKVEDYPLVYPALGLAGETGEVVERVKKITRKGVDYVLTQDDKDYLMLELGDVLWYVARMASVIDVPLSEVVEANQRKIDLRRYGATTDEAPV